MCPVWNKGLTKETSASVRKMATTMRAHAIDNFRDWRENEKKYGKFSGAYRELQHDGDLAELFGVVLGDGSITKFARTESLRIVGSSNNIGFTKRYATLVERVFRKVPHVAKRNDSNAINITLYQKNISIRLGIPTGAKGTLHDVLPLWIRAQRAYTIRYLRGLYEAEGSYSVHEPTYTHKFIFTNTNPHLLDAVFTLISALGFHPHRSKNKIQISRREEVQKAKNLLKFRCYDDKM